VLDQIAIPVFVFFQDPPDRVPYDWRFIQEVALPFPRVQCHGSPLSGPSESCTYNRAKSIPAAASFFLFPEALEKLS